jgi:ATP-dependent Clp protease protease subunit
MKRKKFWEWKNLADEEPETDKETEERILELYGTIAEESWFDDDVTPGMFKEELHAGNGPVTVWLNSPGGDCIAASQIYSMLMDYKGDVTVKIDGIAASAASVIAMAGTSVLMAPTALMMIHNPMTMACGNQDDMQKAIEMLDEVKESIINAYEIKTGMARSKLSRLMDAETWMNANKAIELGFADDFLKDAKKYVPSEDAFSFSGKEAQVRLFNKLSTHFKPTAEETKPTEETTPADNTNAPEETPIADTPAEETANDTPAKDAGTPIDELQKRLNLLK